MWPTEFLDHAIALIQHEVLDFVKLQVALAYELKDTAWSAHDTVRRLAL